MEFLDYMYLKFRKNFLLCFNEITHNDFHLRKVPYKEDSSGDYITYMVQTCDFKQEKDQFPLLILIEWKRDRMFKLLEGLLDGVNDHDAKDFSKEILNISVGHLKGQLSPDSYSFDLATPESCNKKKDIPKYKTFIPIEQSYLVCSTEGAYGKISFYFEEE